MSDIKQYYDIKYPIILNNDNGWFLDLNKNINDKVASQIAHVILTTKGSRYKMPDFGTDLVKYLFEPSDSLQFETISSEIKNKVSEYVDGASINDISIFRDQNQDNTVMLDIKYSLKIGNNIENKRMAIKVS